MTHVSPLPRSGLYYDADGRQASSKEALGGARRLTVDAVGSRARSHSGSSFSSWAMRSPLPSTDLVC